MIQNMKAYIKFVCVCTMLVVYLLLEGIRELLVRTTTWTGTCGTSVLVSKHLIPNLERNPAGFIWKSTLVSELTFLKWDNNYGSLQDGLQYHFLQQKVNKIFTKYMRNYKGSSKPDLIPYYSNVELFGRLVIIPFSCPCDFLCALFYISVSF